MTTSKLRLGVIGAGSWTVMSHLPNLARRRDEVRFVGVARKGPELLTKIRDDWDFEMASEDFQDVIDAGVDIVVVASPTSHHHEHARAALLAGAHVLVEKPFTLTSEQAWDLVDLATARRRHLVVAFGYNYRPVVLEAKRLLDDVGVGEVESQLVYMASITRDLLAGRGAYPLASVDSVPEQRTWTDPATSGGGYGQAQLSHALGAALYLSDLRASEVYATTAAPHGEPVEIYNAMTVRYGSGAIGTVAGAASHPGTPGNRDQLQIRLVGAEGQLEVEFEHDLVNLYRPDGRGARPELEPGAGRYDCVGPPHALVDLALGKDVVNHSPGWLGARTVEVLEASYRSAQSHRPEHVQQRHKAAP